MNRDIYNNLKVFGAIRPQALITSTKTSAAIDTQGYESCMIEVITGTVTDGTHTIKLTECATSGGTYTDVAAADLLGSAPAIAAANDDTQYTFGYIGNLRYLKVVSTVTGSPSTGAYYSASVILGNPRHAPSTD